MKLLNRVLDSLNLSHTHKKVSGNIAWLLGGHIFRMALSILVMGLVARHLGPDQFGILNYAMSLAAILAPLASLGIDGIVVRELVRTPESAQKILGTAFVLRVVGGLIGIVGVYMAALTVRSDPNTIPYVLWVAVAFLPQAFDVIDLWFLKNSQSKFSILARSSGLLLGAGFKIALIVWNASLTWFCIAYVLDFIFIAAGMLIVYGVRGQKMFDWDFSFRMAGRTLRDSWPLITSGLLFALQMRAEQLLVMNFLGSFSAGLYFAAAKIIDLWSILPSFVVNSVYPVLVEKRKNDEADYKRKLQLVFDIMTGLGLLLGLLVCVFAPVLIYVVYGAEYTGAIPILMIQAWAAVIIFSGTMRGQYFFLENINIYHTWTALAGIGCNLLLAFPLMWLMGPSGAAISALISYWVAFYGTSYLFPDLREVAEIQTKALLLPKRFPEFLQSLKGSRG